MNNNEINPRLKELLESLQETPARDSQRHEAGRVNFLSQAKNIQQWDDIHNGDALFASSALPRQGEVGSEITFRVCRTLSILLLSMASI